MVGVKITRPTAYPQCGRCDEASKEILSLRGTKPFGDIEIRCDKRTKRFRAEKVIAGVVKVEAENLPPPLRGIANPGNRESYVLYHGNSHVVQNCPGLRKEIGR